jgi:protein AbiQ
MSFTYINSRCFTTANVNFNSRCFTTANVNFNSRCFTTANVNFNSARGRTSVLPLAFIYKVMNMINFYEVDKNYIKYLQQYEPKIPNMEYHTNQKFVCGIVLRINQYNYYAPISSNKKKQRTNILIKDLDGTTLSSIKFSFMFPANFNYLKKMNFQDIRKQDPAYYNLLLKEYDFCKSNQSKIESRAKQVYKMGCNPDHYCYNVCCKFHLLEQKYRDYNQQHTNTKEVSPCPKLNQ